MRTAVSGADGVRFARMPRRVAITGLGTVCGLGLGARALWDGLCAGRSALAPIRGFDAAAFPCRVWAEVPGANARDHVPKTYRKAVKVMARDAELAVVAARAAVDDARLATRAADPPAPATYPAHRVGCSIGAGLIAAETLELTEALVTARVEGAFSLRAWGAAAGGGGGMANLQPLWLLKYLPNMLACHVTIIHGAEGPSNTITCAESSGLLSILECSRVIARGDADCCFTGSAESKVNLLGLARMGLAGRLAQADGSEEGWRTVRPFDPAAPGGLLGEGGGILILEDAESAAARGATPYAEVAGVGAAQSASDLLIPRATDRSTAERAASPRPSRAAIRFPADDGVGLRDAVLAALDDARVRPGEVDAVVPHAPGVREIDGAAAEGLRRAFGDRIARIPLVTTSPNLGDMLAGGGGVAAAVGAMCLREQRLPARLHAGSPAPDMQAGESPGGPANLRYVVVCGSALGGQNAAVVLRRSEV